MNLSFRLYAFALTVVALSVRFAGQAASVHFAR